MESIEARSVGHYHADDEGRTLDRITVTRVSAEGEREVLGVIEQRWDEGTDGWVYDLPMLPTRYGCAFQYTEQAAVYTVLSDRFGEDAAFALTPVTVERAS